MIGRFVGQEIILQTADGTVRIYLASARDGRASIGIEAPLTVQVVRKELLEREAKGAER